MEGSPASRPLSDVEDNDTDAGQYNSIEAPTLLKMQVDEFMSLLDAINYQETTDPAHALAYRAHLEKLVQRYWDWSLEPDTSTERSAEEEMSYERDSGMRKEVANKLREMILKHPFVRSSPLLLRWPLLASDVPKPAWPLADEVVAVIERCRRKAREGGQERVQEDRMEEKSVDPQIALPAIVSSQHALVGLLHDLGQRAMTQKEDESEDTIGRRSTIIDWRNVLSSISMRSTVPRTVFEATQRRLESIFGQAKLAPSSTLMSNLGMGGRDHIMDTIQNNTDAPDKWQHVTRFQPPKLTKYEIMRVLDRALLLSPVRKRGRYLEPPPVVRKPYKKRKAHKAQVQ